jgi:methylated-DNA-[protein]-cysteine S-methyltransferase
VTISFTAMDSPIGRLWLAGTENGVCRIGLPNESQAVFLAWLARHVASEAPQQDPAALAAVVTQLREYFSRLRQTVWKEVAGIPYGDTTTYGEIARRLGRGRGGARAVGAAVGANPVPIIIPCHRVVGADGSLVGYGGGLDVKEALLRLEGFHL